jgi:hypothetical protein
MRNMLVCGITRGELLGLMAPSPAPGLLSMLQFIILSSKQFVLGHHGSILTNSSSFCLVNNSFLASLTAVQPASSTL